MSEAILQMAEDADLDKVTMRQINDLLIPPIKTLSPKQIKSARVKAKISQNLLAKYLNVSNATYQKWERGEVIPSGGNLKLLNIFYKHGLEGVI